ncbi:hypothetical protein V7152_23540 [Neobacillus drentensis]|uniref:hypothetical protein n=1 Tax=Neobacillus drentensis TaxID=220684 RepID=UPI002FFF59A5
MSEVELQENIEMYLSVVKGIKDSMNIIQGESYLENHKKTLLFSVIDMLAKGVYGTTYRHRTAMFENFILQFCEWEHAERISLQQVVHLLDKTEEGQYQELKEFAKNELYKFPQDRPVYFSYDSNYDQLKELMPTGETKILGIPLKTLSHVSLLWKLRNSLVHEARAKGTTQTYDDMIEPHYIHYTTIGKDSENNVVTTEKWEICHPVGFFNKLIDTALVNVKEYLETNSINPYGNYDFDPLWIEVKRERLNSTTT